MRLRLRLRALLPRRERRPPVRGTVSNVIVVKAPAPCFREALFVLRDEYLGDGAQDREALLRQAREAAAFFADRAERGQLPFVLALERKDTGELIGDELKEEYW